MFRWVNDKCIRGSRDSAVVRALGPLTNVAWVKFPDSVTYVG